MLQRRTRPRGVVPLLAALLALAALSLPAPTQARQGPAVYRNPLLPSIPGDGVVESCADPTIIRAQHPGDSGWYMYCTTDPLNSEDRNQAGDLNFHLIPTLRSDDLVNWTYLGDAFTTRPEWAEPSAGMWAPEIDYFDGTYYLFYGITDVKPDVSGEPASCHDDNAIGVATGPTPNGPWTDIGRPLIEPRRGGPGCNFFWTFDPEVIEAADGQHYIYYGSYYGGIEVRELNLANLEAPGPGTPITIPNRYEGSEVVYRNGYYYLFVSATNCCNGPLTGYALFAGRSPSPLGPFVDREGVSLLAGRVGGTPVLNLNGNRWVGLGHNEVFKDRSGRYWTVYHAVDRHDPYFAGEVGFTKRPVLLDPIDWIDGWPTVRAGNWASDRPQPVPVTKPGHRPGYDPRPPRPDRIGPLLGAYSDEFTGSSLSNDWSWVREPDAASYGLTGQGFSFDTQAADIFVDSNDASVLTRPAPRTNYIVETRVKLNLPPEGCCHNYVQAGLVIYGDDDNFIKLTHVSIWETRQTEFAKELAPVPAGYPRYGNTVGGPPAEWTYLRIARRQIGGEQHYTAYTSQDGERWVRGGTWTHNLRDAGIGLVSMGGSGFNAEFDYVRVYRLR